MIIPESYELQKTEPVPEIGAVAYRLIHKKTRAKVLLMETADDNKVFNIAFRTTPDNSEGTPHIMEHSVLCGSDRFPLKDPFIELAKGSLNTFLNAMTWPDKTAYPVASGNQADFKNLMSVYADAVFCPNIYKTDKILKQEGWHYELESADDELKLNGVVYNEMRGAYSDPDRLLEEKMTKDLYVGTTYQVDSGGDPAEIPNLTYDKFIAFHKRFYHPSNAYIYLYGDLDFTERLLWLDREYLCKYDAIEPHTEIGPSEKKNELSFVKDYYAVSREDTDAKSIFSVAKIVNGLYDPVEYLAFQVLSYALLNAPGAPIKEALLKAEIGTDIYGGYDSGYPEPLFNIVVKGAEENRFEDFRRIVTEVLAGEVKKGICKRTLLAGINNMEFSIREADFGSTPRGLVYWMQIAETWIHDETKALIHLQYNESFEKLKALVETDYFDRLAERALLQNERGVYILLSPKPGLTEERDEALSQKLAAYKASLTPAEIEDIVRETAELRAYQETPSTEEELKKIPLLSLSEIERTPKTPKNEEREIGGIKTLYHHIVTSGIGYLEIFYPTTHVDLRDFPYLSVLRGLYSMMDTEHLSYGDLNNELSFYTGGLSITPTLLSKIDSPREILEYTVISARYLTVHAKKTVELIGEVFGKTKFEDTARLRDVLSEMAENLKDTLENEGHRTAMRRVLSYELPIPYMEDLSTGIGFYGFLKDLLDHFEERKDALVKKLYEVQDKLFNRDGMILSFTGEEKDYEAIKKTLPSYLETVPAKNLPAGDRTFAFGKKNEGFKTASLVQYVAMGGDLFSDENRQPSMGTFEVLRTLMSYEYLWTNVRVKGGAYGCMMQVSRDGRLAFCSYRDPKLAETLAVYRGIPAFLRSLNLSERDLTKYIIGTMGSVDAPKLPAAEGRNAMIAYLMGSTDETRQKFRDAVLTCSVEDLRALADFIEPVLQKEQIVTVGNEAVITKNKDTFMTVRGLANE